MKSHFSAGWTDTSKVKPPSISCVRNGTNSWHAAAFANWNRSAWLRCWTNHSSQRASQPDWQKLQHVAWAKAKDVFRDIPSLALLAWLCGFLLCRFLLLLLLRFRLCLLILRRAGLLTWLLVLLMVFIFCNLLLCFSPDLFFVFSSFADRWLAGGAKGRD